MSGDRPQSAGQRLRSRLTVAAGRVLVRLLGATWRVRLEGPDQFAAASVGGQGVVLAIWHGELLPLIWAHRDRGIAALISTHADGELIAGVVESLGFVPVRGSTSRGGARALLEAVRHLQDGRDVAFTTDGPRGPRHVAAPGAAVAAAKAGSAVVAVGCHVDRAWRFASWDRFVVPKPFARVIYRYGPVLRAAGTRTSDGEALLPALNEALLLAGEP